MAGEITGSGVFSTGAVNTSVGFLSTARQNVGVAEQNGKITNMTVINNGAANTRLRLPGDGQPELGAPRKTVRSARPP